MKRLYRSRRERMLLGVAGGMAEYFNVDPALVRLGWVVAAFASGAGVLGYIAAAIVIPSAPLSGPNPDDGAEKWDDAGDEPGGIGSGEGPDAVRSSGAGAAFFGWLLIALGLLFLGRRFAPSWAWDGVWPALLIALGIYLLIDRGRRR